MLSICKERDSRYPPYSPSSGSTCLGCSYIDKQMAKSYFDGMKDKIECKLAGWKARFLSNASKTVLINPDLAGIPQYSMNYL